MQIGTVARKVGLSVDAIRFYERNALLRRAPRTQGGFRQYGEDDLETLAFIRRVQGLGFRLDEIRGLLSLRGSRMQPCAPVPRRLQEKLADVQRKLADPTGGSSFLRIVLYDLKRRRAIFSIPGAIGKVLPSPQRRRWDLTRRRIRMW